MCYIYINKGAIASLKDNKGVEVYEVHDYLQKNRGGGKGKGLR